MQVIVTTQQILFSCIFFLLQMKKTLAHNEWLLDMQIAREKLKDKFQDIHG